MNRNDYMLTVKAKAPFVSIGKHTIEREITKLVRRSIGINSYDFGTGLKHFTFYFHHFPAFKKAISRLKEFNPKLKIESTVMRMKDGYGCGYFIPELSNVRMHGSALRAHFKNNKLTY